MSNFKGYLIDFPNKTITITADFAEKMQDPSSAEYRMVKQVKTDYPNFEIVARTHATPKSYVDRNGNRHRRHPNRGLTYERIECIIASCSNSEELFASYVFIRYNSAFTPHQAYSAVRYWFDAQFPNYLNNKLWYLFNTVEVLDPIDLLKTFMRKAVMKGCEKNAYCF